MPRKPIDKQGRLRGQEFYWRVMRELGADGADFTLHDVHRKTSASKDSVRGYVLRLERAGYLERSGKRGREVCYRIARDSRFAPRIRRDGSEIGTASRQDHMWRAMKMLGRFSVRDLSVAASTDEVHVASTHAAGYLARLARAGYVRRVGHNPTIYAMLPSANTGPRAPLIQRVKQVFDPNLNKVVWRSGDDE